MSIALIFFKFEKFIVKTFFIPSFLYQGILAFSSLILAFLLGFLFKKLLKLSSQKFTQRQDSTLYTIASYLKFLMTPLLLIIFLSISSIISLELFDSDIFVALAIQMAVIWLIINFVKAFSKNRILSILIGLILLSTLILNVTKLSKPTASFFKKYSISFGKITITAYALIKTLILGSVLIWIASIVSQTVKDILSKKSNIQANNLQLISKIFDMLLYVIVFLIGLKMIGLDLTAFAVLGGAIGVGIGFGLQKITSNFISGIILLAEKSIEVGDLIELKNGLQGKIKKMGARYTLVETFNYKEVLVPNEEFVVNELTNLTYSNKKTRIELTVGVGYDSDLQEVKRLLLEIAEDYGKEISHKDPECYILEFSDHAILFILYVHIKDIDYGQQKTKSDLLFLIWESFKKNNITIPSPKIYIQKEN